jgi:hypothetical protein
MNMPFAVRRLIEHFPSIYILLLQLKNRGRKFEKYIVSKETDLVVEGFPRCANSFAAQSIRLLCRQQGRELRFATHAHSSAQIKVGLKLRKPTLVLIREPKAAIISLLALNQQSGVPERGVNDLLKRYIFFYESLYLLRDQFVVSDFKRTTTVYPEVIQELNRRFDLNLPEVESQSDLDALVMPASKKHLGPSCERDVIKNEVRDRFEIEVSRELFAHADHVYRNFIEVN